MITVLKYKASAFSIFNSRDYMSLFDRILFYDKIPKNDCPSYINENENTLKTKV